MGKVKNASVRCLKSHIRYLVVAVRELAALRGRAINLNSLENNIANIKSKRDYEVCFQAAVKKLKIITGAGHDEKKASQELLRLANLFYWVQPQSQLEIVSKADERLATDPLRYLTQAQVKEYLCIFEASEAQPKWYSELPLSLRGVLKHLLLSTIVPTLSLKESEFTIFWRQVEGMLKHQKMTLALQALQSSKIALNQSFRQQAGRTVQDMIDVVQSRMGDSSVETDLHTAIIQAALQAGAFRVTEADIQQCWNNPQLLMRLQEAMGGLWGMKPFVDKGFPGVCNLWQHSFDEEDAPYPVKMPNRYSSASLVPMVNDFSEATRLAQENLIQMLEGTIARQNISVHRTPEDKYYFVFLLQLHFDPTQPDLTGQGQQLNIMLSAIEALSRRMKKDGDIPLMYQGNEVPVLAELWPVIHPVGSNLLWEREDNNNGVDEKLSDFGLDRITHMMLTKSPEEDQRLLTEMLSAYQDAAKQRSQRLARQQLPIIGTLTSIFQQFGSYEKIKENNLQLAAYEQGIIALSGGIAVSLCPNGNDVSGLVNLYADATLSFFAQYGCLPDRENKEDKRFAKFFAKLFAARLPQLRSEKNLPGRQAIAKMQEILPADLQAAIERVCPQLMRLNKHLIDLPVAQPSEDTNKQAFIQGLAHLFGMNLHTLCESSSFPKIELPNTADHNAMAQLAPILPKSHYRTEVQPPLASPAPQATSGKPAPPDYDFIP